MTQYTCPMCHGKGQQVDFPDANDEGGYIGPCVPCNSTGKLASRFWRLKFLDRRIGRGDDFAGDCWMDLQTKERRYVAVGHNPNLAC